MKADNSAQDNDLSSIPGEFRENYRFLSELINCRTRNDSLTNVFEQFLDIHFLDFTKRLNRRQAKIIKQYVAHAQAPDQELFEPPVPEELEASIRVKRRSLWLPWEAEAIRKIDRWRSDIKAINLVWSDIHRPAALKMRAKSSISSLFY